MYISSLRGRYALRGKSLALVILCAILIFGALFIWRFTVVAAPFAENKARFIAIDTINLAINDYLKENETLFDDLVVLGRDNSGNITSATTNSKNMNKIKSDLTIMINQRLNEDKTYHVRIPMANFLGISILSGVGMPMNLKIHPIAKVQVEFKENFSSEGINQTKLEMVLCVDTTIMVVVPGIRSNVNVSTTLPVTQTVLLGNVPNSYTNFQISEDNPPNVNFSIGAQQP